MADFKIAYNYTLVDADGNLGKVVIHSVVGDAALVSQSVTDLNALGTPLAALTNAKVAGTSYTVQVDAAQGLGTDAPYAGIEDKARLSFRNAFGSKISVSIPAPKDAIFLPPPADDVVNMANALVIAFHTAVTANVVDAASNPINLLTSGIRSTTNFPKLQPRRTAVA